MALPVAPPMIRPRAIVAKRVRERAIQIARTITATALMMPLSICGTAVPMLMHPGELFAAAVWFSLVTWLMLRTRSIWDCVIAHAVTNLLIGLWVLWSGDWWLM